MPCSLSAPPEREITRADVEWCRRVVCRVPAARHMGWDDALGEGLLGLWRAALAFDGRGDFYAYAACRVRNAVNDAARRNDHLSRHHRVLVKAGGLPDEFAPCSLESLAAEGSSWADLLGGADDGDVALRVTLDEALARLPGRTGVIMRWCLDGSMSQREVADLFGLTESRLSQILGEGRERLVSLLRSDPAELLAA